MDHYKGFFNTNFWGLLFICFVSRCVYSFPPIFMEPSNEPYDPLRSRDDFQKFVSSTFHNSPRDTISHDRTLETLKNQSMVTDDAKLDSSFSGLSKLNEKKNNDENMNVLSRVEDLLRLSQYTINAELEVHIGRKKKREPNTSNTFRNNAVSGSVFCSGVSLSWFEDQLKKRESFREWEQCSKDWEKIEEYVFDNDVRLRRIHPNGIATFMKKTTIKGLDISIPDAKYDLRFVLKSENDAHFNYGNPVYYRFKERKYFKHGNFTYFFTKVWEGKTMEHVLENAPKYEIEIEGNQMANDFHLLAHSMMSKCRDLIGKHIPSSNNNNSTTSYHEHSRRNEHRLQSEQPSRIYSMTNHYTNVAHQPAKCPLYNDHNKKDDTYRNHYNIPTPPGYPQIHLHPHVLGAEEVVNTIDSRRYPSNHNIHENHNTNKNKSPVRYKRPNKPRFTLRRSSKETVVPSTQDGTNKVGNNDKDDPSKKSSSSDRNYMNLKEEEVDMDESIPPPQWSDVEGQIIFETTTTQRAANSSQDNFKIEGQQQMQSYQPLVHDFAKELQDLYQRFVNAIPATTTGSETPVNATANVGYPDMYNQKQAMHTESVSQSNLLQQQQQQYASISSYSPAHQIQIPSPTLISNNYQQQQHIQQQNPNRNVIHRQNTHGPQVHSASNNTSYSVPGNVPIPHHQQQRQSISSFVPPPHGYSRHRTG